MAATDCPRIDPVFLETQRAKIGHHHFMSEYCCTFLDAESQLFSGEHIAAALVDSECLPLHLVNEAKPPAWARPAAAADVATEVPGEAVSYIVGLDCGQARDYSAVVVVEKSEVTTREQALDMARLDDRRPPWEKKLMTVRETVTVHHHVVLIARLVLGTSYPDIVADIAELIDKLQEIPGRGAGAGAMDGR